MNQIKLHKLIKLIIKYNSLPNRNITVHLLEKKFLTNNNKIYYTLEYINPDTNKKLIDSVDDTTIDNLINQIIQGIKLRESNKQTKS